jgi:hypothetical protein
MGHVFFVRILTGYCPASSQQCPPNLVVSGGFKQRHDIIHTRTIRKTEAAVLGARV